MDINSGWEAGQLGQKRPANTTAVSIYSPRTEVVAEITSFIVTNNTGTAAKFRIFHDDNGTTYDQSTTLFFDETIPANQSRELIANSWWMRDSTGNIAVRTDTNSAITFTIYGKEYIRYNA